MDEVIRIIVLAVIWVFGVLFLGHITGAWRGIAKWWHVPYKRKYDLDELVPSSPAQLDLEARSYQFDKYPPPSLFTEISAPPRFPPNTETRQGSQGVETRQHTQSETFEETWIGLGGVRYFRRGKRIWKNK